MRNGQPHNLDAERVILASILFFGIIEANEEAFHSLSPTDFYVTAHQKIYGAMQSLAKQQTVIDITTISNEITTVDVTNYLAELCENATSRDISHHCSIVKEKAVLRKLISEAHETIQSAESGEIGARALVDDAQKRFLAISTDTNEKKMSSLAEINAANMGALAKRKPGEMIGMSTGFNSLDEKTAGLCQGDFIVLAGRPSMGKTAFALTIAKNVAKAGGVVAFFSLEMSKEQLGERLLCAEAGINMQMIRMGYLTKKQIEKLGRCALDTSSWPIYVDDSPGIQSHQILTKCRKLKKAQGRLDLVIVDYLQLMTEKGKKGESRQQEISAISRLSKLNGKELGVPYIALSQLSRNLENRLQDKRPKLSDLRESGAIEQDADLVMFLYRDEYYNPDTQDKNITELNIGKQRNGPLATVKFFTNFSTMLYSEVEESRSESDVVQGDLFEEYKF